MADSVAIEGLGWDQTCLFHNASCVCVCVCVCPVLFRLYDSDGDGSVSREDVERVMEAMYKMVGPLLAQEKSERRGEGEQGTEEVEREAEELSATMSARVKEIFNTLDKVTHSTHSKFSALKLIP